MFADTREALPHQITMHSTSSDRLYGPVQVNGMRSVENDARMARLWCASDSLVRGQLDGAENASM